MSNYPTHEMMRTTNCTRCGRNREHFSAEALAQGWTTCSKPCWRAALEADRDALFGRDRMRNPSDEERSR